MVWLALSAFKACYVLAAGRNAVRYNCYFRKMKNPAHYWMKIDGNLFGLRGRIMCFFIWTSCHVGPVCIPCVCVHTLFRGWRSESSVLKYFPALSFSPHPFSLIILSGEPLECAALIEKRAARLLIFHSRLQTVFKVGFGLL